MPDSALTLQALIAIHKRKEHRVRQIVSRIEQQQDELVRLKQAGKEEREELLHLWSEASASTQTLSPKALRAYRSQLAHYYQHAQYLVARCAELEERDGELQRQKQEQLCQLHQVKIKQEKILLMME